MWKVMAESHQTQKRTLDEAKILLAGASSTKSNRRKKQSSISSISDPQRLARSASNLETELRNWRSSFESWITSQRSYIHALKGWLLRCVRSEADAPSSKPGGAWSPRRSSSTHPMFGLCVQWCRRVDAVQETAVVDGMDFFAAGMGSLYTQQMASEEAFHRNEVRKKEWSGNINNMEMVEVGREREEEEGMMSAEKMAEVAIKVLCAGMSVAVTSLTEFAFESAEGYDQLVKQWENVKWQNIIPKEAKTT